MRSTESGFDNLGEHIAARRNITADRASHEWTCAPVSLELNNNYLQSQRRPLSDKAKMLTCGAVQKPDGGRCHRTEADKFHVRFATHKVY